MAEECREILLSALPGALSRIVELSQHRDPQVAMKASTWLAERGIGRVPKIAQPLEGAAPITVADVEHSLKASALAGDSKAAEIILRVEQPEKYSKELLGPAEPIGYDYVRKPAEVVTEPAEPE